MADYLVYLSHIWSGFVNFFRRDPRKRGVTHDELEKAFSDFLTNVTESIKKGDLGVSDLSKERIKILQQEVTKQISRSQEYICGVVAAHDVQLDEQNKNDRNSLRKEARDLREEFKAVKEARIPELQPYVKEVVESILSKLVPLEVEKSAPSAVKKAFEDLLQEKRPQLEEALEKNLISIINKLEGVKERVDTLQQSIDSMQTQIDGLVQQQADYAKDVMGTEPPSLEGTEEYTAEDVEEEEDTAT